jgi:hypothetical protein
MQVVNGYVCRDCTDIERAKKGIDPKHPEEGPYGRNRDPNDPTRSAQNPTLATTGYVGTRLHVIA